MVEVLAGAAAAALSEGVKFLYQQAGEVLTAWRARRCSGETEPPKILTAPTALTVGEAHPVADPQDGTAIDTLQTLKDLVEPITDGTVDISSAAARQAIAGLRDILESALRASITFAGERPRPVRIDDVRLVVERVGGNVAGLRADLTKLRQPIDVGTISVSTGDVTATGQVTGLDLT